MKKNIQHQFITLLFLAASFTTFAQLGIGTTTPQAALDVVSTTQGFLPPRMDTAQRNTMSYPPPTGLMIFNTTAKCLQWFDGSLWIDGCGGVSAPAPNPNIKLVDNVTYQGTSVIDATGIGYNGENVPAASTITVELTNTSPDSQSYSLLATDPTTGLSYSATETIDGNASGVSVVLNHNGVMIPEFFSGVITMELKGTSSTISLKPRIDIKSIPASATTMTDVSYGDQIWMDRNLGARRVATAVNDVFSYGNHYQWGRPADGHEISVWNGTTKNAGRGLADASALEALATTDVPGHPNFILTNVAPYDWRSDNNNNRWATASQGPCPAGYHVPTDAEWLAADAYDNGAATNGGATVGWDNNTETFASALKLPSAGYRYRMDGLLKDQGAHGTYWSSMVSGTNAPYLRFNSTSATTTIDYRAFGNSVRCIKD